MTDDSIGIDISKDKLDVHRLCDGAFAQFPDSPNGFRALVSWIGAVSPERVVYEATGAYHGAMERFLSEQLPLVKVNPLQAKRFAQSQDTRAKTDKADAKMLAQIGGSAQTTAPRSRAKASSATQPPVHLNLPQYIPETAREAPLAMLLA